MPKPGHAPEPHNLERAIAFYRNILGLLHLEQPTDGILRFG